jgi:acyl carrier protein
MAEDSGSAIDRDAIFQIIRTQLAEILEIDADSIALSATFSDLGADSLALIELVEALEEALASYAEGFHIDDEDLEGLGSVSDAVNYVATKLQVA